MTAIQFSGKWDGHYVYGRQFSEEKQKVEVAFVAVIVVEDGVLSGTAEEPVTRDLMERPAALSGFIEGNVISFIKQYPYYYWEDKNGKYYIDRTRLHPPVHYSGLYDPASDAFTGEWEIEVFLDRDEYGEDSYLITGTWELRRS